MTTIAPIDTPPLELSQEVNETVSGLNGFMDKLTDATVMITEKLVDIAPAVAQELLYLIQLKGGFHLAVGFLFLGIGGFCCIKCKTLLLFLIKDEDDMDEGVAGLMIFGTIVSGVMGIFLTIVSLNKLIVFGHWLAVISPEGYLALEALSAAGIEL